MLTLQHFIFLTPGVVRGVDLIFNCENKHKQNVLKAAILDRRHHIFLPSIVHFASQGLIKQSIVLKTRKNPASDWEKRDGTLIQLGIPGRELFSSIWLSV